MFVYSVASESSVKWWLVIDSVCLRIVTGVIFIGDVYTTDHYVILAEMKGCQVSK